ncbi:MAG: DUF2147 domain-containing protein [Spirochaetia bacterium]|nr:DUF2147 domain-containing protein [Spirochaetia bacterium]
MKKITLFLIMFLFHGSFLLAQNMSPVGEWKTIDDETGKQKSLVQIWIDSNGKLYGKILSLFREPHEDQDPVCDKCDGDRKDKKIIGMQIIWDLEKDSESEWEDGYILDPKKGKTYGCNIQVIENGQKLKVRGFIGFSLIGRTQIWHRIK